MNGLKHWANPIKSPLRTLFSALVIAAVCSGVPGCHDTSFSRTLPQHQASKYNRPAHLPRGVVTGPLQALEDPTAAATLDDVRNADEQFLNVRVRCPNYFFTRSAIWLRLPIENQRDEPIRLFLDVEHPTLDDLTLHVVSPTRKHPSVQTGDRMPARDRPFQATSLIMPFTLDPHESADLYLRVHAEAAAMLIPVDILDEPSLHSIMLKQRFLHGAMLGLFFALFVYNLLVLALLREVTYFFYVCYLASCYLAIISLDGIGESVFFPRSIWFGNEGLVVLSGISFTLVLLFVRSFLHTSTNARLDQCVRVLIYCSVFLVLSPSVMPIGQSYRIAMAMVYAFPVINLMVGVATWEQGKTEARFFVLGQVASCIGLILFGAMMAGVLPYNLLLFEGISIGVSIDALLLALALADRIRILQRAKRQAEETARRNLELRQEELEQMVYQRTAELELARKQAEVLATTDPLTGVFNRRGLLDRAERDLQLAVRSGRPLSLVIFDIDHFKCVNDAHGHAEGDRVLCAVVGTVKRLLRSTDLFGRIGGEEFLLVMPETTPLIAFQIAERIRLGIAAGVTAGPDANPVTASFGVASIREQRDDLDRLQSTADAALYRAKHKGRNRVECAVHAFIDEFHETPSYVV